MLFAAALALPAQAQNTSAPDCVVQGTFTATGRQGGPNPARIAEGFNNKTAGCITWYLSITSTGFSATSIALQSAPDSSGVAGTWVNFAGTIVYGTNPTTTTTQTIINATGFYPWISVNAGTLTGTGTVTWSLVGWKGAASFAVSVGPPVGTTDVNCVSGCAGGTTDTDDGAVAGGQTTSIQIGLPYLWNGSGWVRMLGNATDGLLVNLGANNDVTVTGNVTAVQATGTNLHTVVDSGTISTITNPVTVTDGAGALNVIADSGTITTVSTVTNLSQMSGAAIAMGTGARSAGTQRVTVATDDLVPVTVSAITASASGPNTGANSDSVVCATDTKCVVKGDGTAGSASAGVLTVQGIASMTPIKVDVTTISAAASGPQAAATSDATVQAYNTLISGITSNMTGTTSTQVIAGTASNYQYISWCVVDQDSITVSTAILLQDGSGGTTLARLPAPSGSVATTGASGAVINFPRPLKVPTSGNGLYAQNVTTGSDTYVTCGGERSTISY